MHLTLRACDFCPLGTAVEDTTYNQPAICRDCVDAARQLFINAEPEGSAR